MTDERDKMNHESTCALNQDGAAAGSCTCQANRSRATAQEAWEVAVKECVSKIEAQTWLKREDRECLKKALLEVKYPHANSFLC